MKVVLGFLFFEGPGVVLQEDLDGLLQGVVGVDLAFNFLAGYGFNRSLEFIVFLKHFPFIAETFLGNHWFFHQHEGHLADQVVWDFFRLLQNFKVLLQSLDNLFLASLHFSIAIRRVTSGQLRF